MIRISAGFYFFAAMMFLLLPLPWIAASLFAAGFHELCHTVCIYLMGGSVREFRIGAGGAVLEAELEGNMRELICALAGPLGSLALLCFLRIWPQAAICGSIQGTFNLLPLYPLDGGRVLRCALDMTGRNTEITMRRVEKITVLAAFLLSTALFLRYPQRKTVLFFAFLLFLKWIL